MCGIFCATPQNDRTSQMIPYLAWEIESRGTDSWGATNGEEIYRSLGAITSDFRAFPEWKNALYHTRQASKGAVTVENSHPFRAEGDKGWVVGVHNGAVSNHEKLNKENNRSCSVDSQHIFMHLAEGKDLNDLEAWGVAVWFTNNLEEVHFIKFSSHADWHVGELKDHPNEFIMCSFEEPIARAARMGKLGEVEYYKITPGHEYVVRDGKIVEGDKIFTNVWGYITTKSFGGYQGLAKEWGNSKETSTFPHIFTGAKPTEDVRLSTISQNSHWLPCSFCLTRYIESSAGLVCKSCFEALTKNVDGHVPPTTWRKNGPAQKLRLQP